PAQPWAISPNRAAAAARAGWSSRRDANGHIDDCRGRGTDAGEVRRDARSDGRADAQGEGLHQPPRRADLGRRLACDRSVGDEGGRLSVVRRSGPPQSPTRRQAAASVPRGARARRTLTLDGPTGACSTSAVDEPAKPSTPPLVLGRYLLGAQLGQGGMGRVHAATDTRLGGRKVAVKTLVVPDVDPDMKEQLTERFKREPEILALIKHEHVVDVLDHGCDADGTLYLVTELLEGDNL